jgi:lipoate-protein ligase A
MNQILYSSQTNPYYNVALEYTLMKKNPRGITLFLWKNCPSVFVGRNQNLYMECSLAYLKEASILPVRRLSGGGAVFQDEGNLNFTFLCGAEDVKMEQFPEMIQKTVETMGISCKFTGRNDLLYNGKKFSGHAYYEEDGRLFYHGTMLCSTNLEMMEKALTPSAAKLESKGISSVKSRVMNLSEVIPELTVRKVAEQLADQFIQTFGRTEQTRIRSAEEAGIVVPREEILKLQSPEWLYGQSPDWSVQLERHFPEGLVSALVSVKDGRIADIRIYTDCLKPVDWQKCERRLAGRWYDEDEVFDELGRYVLS